MPEKGKTLILGHDEIDQKITRMAWQLLENNYDAEQVILIGVEKKGTIISQLIAEAWKTISQIPITLGTVAVDKENPTLADIRLKCELDLKGQHVILVDDVLNSGKTLMYATLPILAQNPCCLQTAILANRDHTSFPVKADVVGISMATTLREHINFVQDENGNRSVFLD